MTSATDLQRLMATARRSIMPFQTDRERSYAASGGASRSLLRLASSVAKEVASAAGADLGCAAEFMVLLGRQGDDAQHLEAGQTNLRRADWRKNRSNSTSAKERSARASMALELRIALLAAPETTPSALFGLYDVLISVGAVYPDMTGRQVGESLLDVRIVAADAQPFRRFGNILIEPHAAIGSFDRVDAAVVCDMYTPIDAAPRGRYATEIEWLRRMHAQGALIASVCSGSLVLAEAGLLDGRQCAGHWAYRELRRQYPKVNYRADSILRLACSSARSA